MTTIAERMQAIRRNIDKVTKNVGRNSGSVRLLAVSKSQAEAKLREAFEAGQTCFGENYVQEALEKISAMADLPIEWHFIGPIQSNKARLVAEQFDWVHTVDRLKIAQRLDQARPTKCAPLNVCIQVNVSEEASKSGCARQAVRELAQAMVAMPQLKLRGLMAIPEPTTNIALQHQQFRSLAQLRDDLNQSGMELDTLSMGMSGDYATAIAEGSTIVRIGTAIFGSRTVSERLTNQD